MNLNKRIIIIVFLLLPFILGLQNRTQYVDNTGALWHMNTGSGASIFDASRNVAAGTITDATWVTGKYGSALDFNGTSASVLVANDSDINFTSSLTILVWIKPVTIDHEAGVQIMRKADAGGWHFFLTFLAAGPILRMALQDAGDFIITDTAINKADYEGKWSHIAVVYDDDTNWCYTYKNGVEIDKDEADFGDLINSTKDLYIGSYKGTEEFFKGIIDEVGLYSRAWSQGEVMQAYRGGTARHQ